MTDPQKAVIISITYEINGELYEIHETPDILAKLESDAAFAVTYLQGRIGSLCDTPFSTDSTPANAGLDSTSQSAPPTESSIDIISPNEEGVPVDDNDEDTDAKNSWDTPATKFLLSAYLERQDKFRNPLIKKITLFREIEKELGSIGYSGLDAGAIDRKMRNIKSTYKRKKTKKKQTGRDRDTWPWYKEASEIFDIDKSVNFNQGISSMAEEDDSLEVIDFSTHRLSPPTLSFKNCLENYASDLSLSYIHFLSSSYDALWDNDFDSSTDAALPSCSRVNEETSNSSHSSQFTQQENTDLSSTPLQESSIKSVTSKRLYSQRNKALKLESKKIKILESIDNKFQENRNLNERISELVMAQNRRAAAMEKRNDLLEKKNEILEKKNELLMQLLRSKTIESPKASKG